MRTGPRSRVRWLVALLMATATVVIAGAAPAHACSCRADADVAEMLATSDGAFVGVLTGVEDPFAQGALVSSARQVVNHFDVERVVKGQLGEQVDVRAAAAGASCGLEVRVGQRVGILLLEEGGTWTSSLCAQTEPDLLLAFAAPGDSGDAAGSTGSRADTLFVVAGVVALAVFGVLAARVALAGTPRRRR